MREFVKEFDPARGDLIYGRSTVRDVYEQTYATDTQRDAIKLGAWVRIDDWNNDTALNALKETEDPNELLSKSLEYAKYAEDNNITQRDLQGYSTGLFASRYSPVRALAEPPQKHDQENAATKLGNLQFRIIRKACKFGIDHLVSTMGAAQVHFAIDDINMADVVQKAKFGGQDRKAPAVPITTSELRSIYRKWHHPAYPLHIIFYDKGQEVPAPWVSDVNLWNGYGLHRYEKFLAMLHKEMKEWSNKFAKNTKAMEQSFAPANKKIMDFKKLGKYNQAVEVMVAFMNETLKLQVKV